MNNSSEGKALFFSGFIEFGERYSYYVIQSLLIFFLINQFGIAQSYGASLIGTTIGMIYISSIVGGYIADKLIGYYPAALIGIILMVVGSFLLAISFNENILFIGLAFISTSTGLIKSNMSAFLSDFYSKSKLSDGHRDFGFTVFYMGINCGSLFALFFASHLKDKFGFAVPFYSSFFCVIAIFVVACIGFIYLQDYINKSFYTKHALLKTFGLILGYILLVYIVLSNKYIADFTIIIALVLCLGILFKSVNDSNKNKVLITALFFALSIFYWSIFFQRYISVLLFIDKNVAHQVFGITLGSSGFLAVEPFSIIFLGGFIGKFWIKLEKTKFRVYAIDKFAIGFLFIAITFMVMYLGIILTLPNEKVHGIFIVLAFVLMAISELSFSAIGLSVITKNAPDKYVSLYMGVWLVTIGIGGKLAGIMSSFISITDNLVASKNVMSLGLLYFFAIAIVCFIMCIIARIKWRNHDV